MAIRIVEGVPGSGKTYYAVHHLVTNYFKWDDAADAYVKRDPRLRVISNIDGFHAAESLAELVASGGGLGKFFTWAYQKQLAAESRLVYVIDEAQILFGRAFRNVDVFAFFQKHRHLGIDVYLITQDVRTLALELRNLAEYYVRAVRRTYSFLGEFRYKFVASPEDKDGFKTKVLRRDAGIFAMYSSMTRGETESIGSAPRRILMWALVLAVVCVSIFYYVVAYAWPARARIAPVKAPVGAQGAPKHTVERPPGWEPETVVERPPRLPDDGFVASRNVVVRGVVGDEDNGSVYLDSEDGRSQVFSAPAFRLLCRCRPESLSAGLRVQLYERVGVSPPAPLRVRASGASAPVDQSPRTAGAQRIVGRQP